MPRPRKCRKICALPNQIEFGPLNSELQNNKTIIMTVDEYEAIRLIDVEGLDQEACSILMSVARTTAQRIYNEARQKLATAIIDGNVLKIEGGDYELCTKSEGLHACEGCKGRKHHIIDHEDLNKQTK